LIKSPKILFFVNDCVPTEEQLLEAQGYGSRVSFRNATFVPAPVYKSGKDSEGKAVKTLVNANFLEKCDAVAGEVPELYKNFPKAEEVLEKFEEDRKKRLTEAKAAAKKTAAQKKKDAAKANAEKQKAAAKTEEQPAQEWTANE
jgi:hypothetical protein